MVANLTIEQVETALQEVPKHRTELRQDLKNTLSLMRRGIEIKDNAPIWVQVQNVVFAWQFVEKDEEKGN